MIGLRIVFLFIDHIALTLVYVILFIYIRVHAKRFHEATVSQTERSREIQERRSSETSQTTFANQSSKPQLSNFQIDEESSRNATTNHLLSTHHCMNKVAYSLLFYPFSCIFHTLPVAILRVVNFSGTSSSNYGAVYFAVSLYCCSGWTTVLLYTATRKGLISWNWLGRCMRRRSVMVTPVD